MPPHPRAPNLAQRHAELSALGWPGSSLTLVHGRELRFSFSIAPTALSRSYRCLLKVYVSSFPELFVLEPDPKVLAAGRSLPHVYPHVGRGSKLCLWLPNANEWCAQMRLEDTYLPWAAEWLDYFEEWLVTDHWAGGGEHPRPRRKRWARATSLKPTR